MPRTSQSLLVRQSNHTKLPTASFIELFARRICSRRLVEISQRHLSAYSQVCRSVPLTSPSAWREASLESLSTRFYHKIVFLSLQGNGCPTSSKCRSSVHAKCFLYRQHDYTEDLGKLSFPSCNPTKCQPFSSSFPHCRQEHSQFDTTATTKLSLSNLPRLEHDGQEGFFVSMLSPKLSMVRA
jgi:hypothetical protein